MSVAVFNLENCPLCPECDDVLDYESAGNRDSETMGGCSVEYARCCNCHGRFEIIDSPFDGKKIYPCSAI